MKRLVVFVLFFFLCGVSCYSASIVENVRELKKRRSAGEISESEYQELLRIIIGSKDSSSSSSSSSAESSLSSQPEAGTIGVQINVVATKYWRAKELVTLTPSLSLICNGRRCVGKTLVATEDRVIVAFVASVNPGVSNFKVNYRPKVSDDKNWREKTFSFDFSQEINSDCEINKVIEFIEDRNKGSAAGVKFLSQSEYDQLLAGRREKETKDNDQLKRVLGSFFK